MPALCRRGLLPVQPTSLYCVALTICLRCRPFCWCSVGGCTALLLGVLCTIKIDVPRAVSVCAQGNFQMTVEEGEFTDSEIIVMLGENGTGKTTFIRMLAGMLAPDEVRGVDVRG